MKQNTVLAILFGLASLLILSSRSGGVGKLAGQAATGAPGETTCFACHGSFPLNSGSDSVRIIGPSNYIPGNIYTITVQTSGSTTNRYGFQLVVLNSSQNNMGTLSPSTGTGLVTIGGRTYIEHTQVSSSGTWSFNWQAPAVSSSSAFFYVAANVAGFPNSNTGGDKIYTYEIEVPKAPSPPKSIFTADKTEICLGESVVFTNQSTGTITNSFWNFGTGANPSGAITSGPHQVTYNTPGYKTIRLISTGPTGTDTLEKKNYVFIGSHPQISIQSPRDTICSADTISLTASGTQNYLWTPSSEIIGNTNSPTVNISPDQSVTYTLIGTDTIGCSTTVFHPIVVNTSPILEVAPFDTSICFGDGIQITASGATNYFWSPAQGLDTTLGNRVFASPLDTIRYLLLGSNSNGCVDSANVSLDVEPEILLSLNNSQPVICAGDSVKIIVTTNSLLNWVPSAGVSNDTGKSVWLSPSTTTTYTLSATSESGFCFTEKTVHVQVNPKASAVVSLDKDSICQGDSILIQAGVNQTNSYSWSHPQLFDQPTSLNGYIFPAQDVSLQLNVNNSFGCNDSVTIPILVDQQVIAEILQQDTLICSSDTLILEALGSPNSKWTWDSQIKFGQSLTISPDQNTRYYYHTQSLIGLCTAKDSLLVVSKNSPNLTLNQKDFTICPGDSIELTAGGAADYQWSPSVYLNNTTGNFITATPQQAITYKLIGSNLNGCFDTTFIDFSLDTSLNLTISDPTPQLCEGESKTLIASGATDYSWTPNQYISNNVGASVQITPPQTITYTLIGYGLTENCADTTTIQVYVNPNPVVTTNIEDTIVCSGSQVPLAANGAMTYIWEANPQLSCQNCQNTISTITRNDKLIVKGFSVYGCIDMDTVEVNIFNTLPIQFTTGDTAICENKSFTEEITSQGTFNWSPPNGLSIDTGKITTISPASSITYTITGTDIYNCALTDSLKVEVLPNPIVHIQASDTLLCDKDTLNLIGSGAQDYIWAPIGLTNCGNCASTFSLPSTDTTYTLTGISKDGCQSTEKVRVEVIPLPYLTFDKNPETCFGTGKQLNISGADAFQWLPSDSLTCSNCPNPTTFKSQTTIYTILATNQGLCTVEDSMTFTVNPLPVPEISSPDGRNICFGDYFTMDAGTYLQYTWSPVYLGSTQLVQDVADSSRTYTVTVVDQSSCVGSDTFKINMKDLPISSISFIGGKFISNYGENGDLYEWYKDSNKIAGAVDSFYKPQVSGIYYLKIINKWGCESTSNSVYYVHIGIEENLQPTTFVYPNPTSDFVQLKLPSQFSTIETKLYSVNGDLMWSGLIPNGVSQFKIDMQSFPKGVYLLEMNLDNQSEIQKIYKY